MPANAAGIVLSTWNVYVNGAQATTFTGPYPANLLYTSNYLGKGVAAADSYVGHLDSFFIFRASVNVAQARAMFAVRITPMFASCDVVIARMHACVYAASLLSVAK